TTCSSSARGATASTYWWTARWRPWSRCRWRRSPPQRTSPRTRLHRAQASSEARVCGPAGQRRAARRLPWDAVAERGDASKRVGHVLAGEGPLRHRLLHAAHRGARRVERLADEQRVAAGAERGDRRARRRRARGHRVHLEVVAEQHPAEAEAAAQEVAADGGRERGGAARIERGVEDVRGHERWDAVADGAREGCQLHRGEGTPRAADAREDEVRVADARAVPGEVLPAREHAVSREPACERDSQTGDPGRVGPEGAVADHAV